jgi:multisubunit Na+/H+ antiporter MnhB subunit
VIAERSPIVEIGIQASTPFALVIGTYLLFAGHNRPGGGFAAGLIFGAVVALRTIVGLQRPAHGMTVVAVGVAVVAAVALAPVLWGRELLDQLVVSADVPVLGTIKSGSALPFDIGVAVIVVGLIVAALDGLGGSGLTPRSATADGTGTELGAESTGSGEAGREGSP